MADLLAQMSVEKWAVGLVERLVGWKAAKLVEVKVVQMGVNLAA